MSLATKRNIRCIGAPISAGAPFRGAERGPPELMATGLGAWLAGVAGEVRWEMSGEAMLQSTGLADWLESHAELCAQVVRDGDFPLVIGGDHSMAAATWRGIGRAFGRAPGLLWIDAHLDAHTPITSPSGNLHGMPVAALLGEGESVLSRVAGPPLQPGGVVLLSGHSYEPAELKLLRQLGVSVHLLSEVRQRGLGAWIDDVCCRFGDRSWGISLDIDAVDPVYAPGVSTPVPGGLTPEELLIAMAGICRRPGCVAFEIAEFNPDRDQLGQTRRLIETICQTAFAESTTG